jgi:hypothetical protein
MLSLLAQAVGVGGIAYYLIWIIILVGLFAIAIIAIRGIGVSIPPWATQIFWIVLLVTVAVVAIKFLLTAI